MSRRASSSLKAAAVILVIVVAFLASLYLNSYFSMLHSTVLEEQRRFNDISNRLNELNSTLQKNLNTLPLVNQAPKVVRIVETWELAPNAQQDRFTPYNIIVNQGDTIQIAFIVNDTAGHTFTIGAPYNFQINDSIPGMTNDLTGMNFTTLPTNNSPGVKIIGGVGNLTGVGSFVARYPGIYLFTCVYHIQKGMFGYLIVMPNKAYGTVPVVSVPSKNVTGFQVSIVKGSYDSNQHQNYVPNRIIVVIGKNNTITWTNNDVAAHTVTSDSKTFNSGNMNPGESWTYTFTTPGTYTYFCEYHPWMRGTVIVKVR